MHTHVDSLSLSVCLRLSVSPCLSVCLSVSVCLSHIGPNEFKVLTHPAACRLLNSLPQMHFHQRLNSYHAIQMTSVTGTIH